MSLHHAGGWERRRLCLPRSLWRGGASDSAILSLKSSKGTSGFEQAVTRILADYGISTDDATQVRKVFHGVRAIDADLRRTVRLSWRRLLGHLSLLQADGEAEVPGCIRKVVGDVL